MSNVVPFPETNHLVNVEAEQALLGAILVENRVLDKVASVIEGADFFYPVHGRIFEACLEMHRAGKVANPVTLGPAFADDPGLEETGGRAYLARLAGSAVTVINAKTYAEAVVEMSLRRQIADVEASGARAVVESPLASFRAVTELKRVRRRLDEIEGRLTVGDDHTHTVEAAAAAAIDAVEKAYQRNGALPGITTGLPGVDELIGGLQAPDLVIVAGATGAGKTAMAVQLALAAARRSVTTMYASLEMSAAQLATRMLAMETEIEHHRLRMGRLAQPEFETVLAARRRIREWPLHIVDRGGQTLDQISTAARRYARSGLGLLVVDYLQFMRPSREAQNTMRVYQIAEMTGGLKALAKDLGIPIVLLSQLSRAPSQRDIKRPNLSDLRDSGSIEQDADIVCLLYRKAYYLERERPDESDGEAVHSEWEEKMAKVAGRLEFIVAKNRHGATGTVDLRWDGPTMQVRDPN